MAKDILEKLESWNYHRNLAMDILDALSDEQLGLSVGKNMGTFGEQFRHMARVQRQYSEAMTSGRIQDVAEKIDPLVSKSKEDLVRLHEYVSNQMLNKLQGLDEKELEELKIDWTHWGIQSMNLHDHLQALVEHQILHNGQLVVYLRTHGISFPSSWKAWGL